MRRSIYWWSDYGVARADRSNKTPRRLKQAIRAETSSLEAVDIIYPRRVEWQAPPRGTESEPRSRCCLRHFLSIYYKSLTTCLFWAAASLWILIGYGGDFVYLGIACILYYALLLLGLVISLGLPIKWYRDYGRADGFVIQ